MICPRCGGTTQHRPDGAHCIKRQLDQAMECLRAFTLDDIHGGRYETARELVARYQEKR